MGTDYFVYILASDAHQLYIGVTNNLRRRVWEHRNDVEATSYCSRHGINRLVYFEITRDVRSAIWREKQLKRFHRREKLQLVERMNPEWRDLAKIYLR
jgi:putative endonuclease